MEEFCLPVTRNRFQESIPFEKMRVDMECIQASFFLPAWFSGNKAVLFAFSGKLKSSLTINDFPWNCKFQFISQ